MEKTDYTAAQDRYTKMEYRRCGRSGLRLPAVSLGLWHNFGSIDNYENYSAIALEAFDAGITHFDLANNYGPVPGSAETNFGRIMRESLHPYRDEMIISTKAGYLMWDGPYGDWGSRKYLMASLDQSLRRMGLEYVDIFYSHRPDPDTPLEETMGALSDAVRQGLRGAGYSGSFYPVGGGQEFAALWEETGMKTGLLLFKGSRGNRLERLLDTFRACCLNPGASDAV